MADSLILVLLLASLTISILLLGVSFKWPTIGRFLFVLLFLWAAYINTKTAILVPEEYLDYASFAWLSIYRNFILGFFANHITTMVITIAFFQFLIAVLLFTKGPLVKWGGWMAIFFLVSIAPLGIGSGFPTTLILAAGIYLIIRKPVNHNLWEIIVDKLLITKS